MNLTRWSILAISAIMLSCICVPPKLASNLGLNDSAPTSSSKHLETLPPTPIQTEAGEVKASIPTRLATEAKPGEVKPTENENTPKMLPAEMGTSEPKKPFLELMNAYIDPQNLYRVDYPAHWLISKTGGWVDICMDQEKYACLHVQTEDLNNRMLDNFMDDTYEIFKSSVGEYTLFKREEVLLSGEPAVMFEQSYTFHGEYNQGFAAYLINFNKKTGYVVQAEIVGQMDDYDLIYETLREMVGSFSVGG